MPSIDDLVREVPTMRSTTPFWDVVQERLDDGDMDWGGDLGLALIASSRSHRSGSEEYLDTVASLISSLSQIPAEGALSAALRVAAAQVTLESGYAPATASVLAASPRAAYIEIAYDPASGLDVPDELRACVAMEMVLRGFQLRASQPVAAWLDSPAWTTHPLSWLPLEVTDVEAERHLPDYHGHGFSQGLPSGEDVKDASTEYTAFTGTLPAAVETTTTENATRMGTAVRNWNDYSNGVMETRAFQLSGDFPLERLPNVVTSLGLKSLASTDNRPPLTVGETTLDRVWEILFSAASSGCSYSPGLKAAYGRLATWQSIGALAGAESEATFHEVHQRAKQTRWHLFAADTEWFYNFIHDIGIISINPERHLRYLAATDID